VFKKTRENHQINLKLSPIDLCRNLLVFGHQKQVNFLKNTGDRFFYDEDCDVRVLRGLARGWRGKMENGIYPFEIPRCYLMVLGIL